jgi:IS5 family transposase
LLNLFRQKQKTNQEDFSVRETRVPQASIFDSYSEHEFGKELRALSNVLDDNASVVLPLIENDLIGQSVHNVGRCGLSVESVFRCLLLKQMLQLSYDDLAFHLSDSMSYRTFARITGGESPKRSSLQASIRQIKADTLAEVFQALSSAYFDSGIISLEKIRIDSTVVKSNIATPRDSQLLNDGVRVLSRLLSKSRDATGVKIRFTDKRKESKSLSFQILNAKKPEKDTLYPKLLRSVGVVLKQVERALQRVKSEGNDSESQNNWISQVKHYRDLLLSVVEQTKRRVFDHEKVPASEKVVSLFEEHTDIIVKGRRDVQYGHKINLSSDGKGFITYLSIEKGNPSDADRFIPVLDGHLSTFGKAPSSTVSDGCYASLDNIKKGKALGIARVVFHKKRGLSYRDMGVKEKTFNRLKDFRAGVEGNISELKRAFGASKATWKGLDGFKAFVWSSVLSYNLVRLARAESG